MKMLYELFCTELKKRCSNKQKLKAIKVLRYLFVESGIPFEIKNIVLNKKKLNVLLVNNPLDKNLIIMSGYTTPLHSFSSKAYLSGNKSRQNKIAKDTLVFSVCASILCAVFGITLLVTLGKFTGFKKIIALVLLVITLLVSLLISNNANTNNSSFDISLAISAILTQENPKYGLILLEDSFESTCLENLISEIPELAKKRVVYLDPIQGKEISMYANGSFSDVYDKFNKDFNIGACDFIHPTYFDSFENLLYIAAGELLENKQVMFEYVATNNDTFVNTEYYDSFINALEEYLKKH